MVVLVCTVILTWILVSSKDSSELARKLLMFDFVNVLYALLLIACYVLMGVLVAVFINKYCIHESLHI